MVRVHFTRQTEQIVGKHISHCLLSQTKNVFSISMGEEFVLWKNVTKSSKFGILYIHELLRKMPPKTIFPHGVNLLFQGKILKTVLQFLFFQIEIIVLAKKVEDHELFTCRVYIMIDHTHHHYCKENFVTAKQSVTLFRGK